MVVFLATVSVMNLSSDEDEEDSAGGPGTTTTTTTPTPTPTAEDLADRFAEAEAEVAELRALEETLTLERDAAQAKNAELNTEISKVRSKNSELQTTASATTIPLGVEQGYYCFRINLVLKTIPDPASTEELPLPGIPEPGSLDQLVEDFSAQIGAAEIQDRLAGSVLTFGVSPPGTGQGRRNAERFNKWVLPELPMFDLAARRHFWDGSPGAGKIDNGFRVDIYLLDDGEGPPPLGLDNKPDCG